MLLHRFDVMILYFFFYWLNKNIFKAVCEDLFLIVPTSFRYQRMKNIANLFFFNKILKKIMHTKYIFQFCIVLKFILNKREVHVMEVIRDTFWNNHTLDFAFFLIFRTAFIFCQQKSKKKKKILLFNWNITSHMIYLYQM